MGASLLIMAGMLPLILMFRLLARLGAQATRLAAVLVWLGASGLLYVASRASVSSVASAWAGIVGGLLAWTLAELSHTLGLADIEAPAMFPLLALHLAALGILWPHLPAGAQFWLICFTLNWSGHVFMRFVQQKFARARAACIFYVAAGGFGLLLLGLLGLAAMCPLSAVALLWVGTGLWFSFSMIFFLAFYPHRLSPPTENG